MLTFCGSMWAPLPKMPSLSFLPDFNVTLLPISLLPQTVCLPTVLLHVRYTSLPYLSLPGVNQSFMAYRLRELWLSRTRIMSHSCLHSQDLAQGLPERRAAGFEDGERGQISEWKKGPQKWRLKTLKVREFKS